MIELKNQLWIIRVYNSLGITIVISAIAFIFYRGVYLGLALSIWAIVFLLVTFVLMPDAWLNIRSVRLCKGVTLSRWRFAIRSHPVPRELSLVLRYITPGRNRVQHGWYLGALNQKEKWVWFEFDRDKKYALEKMSRITERLQAGGIAVTKRVEP